MVAVTPSNKLSSSVVAVNPSKTANSLSVTVLTATLPFASEISALLTAKLDVCIVLTAPDKSGTILSAYALIALAEARVLSDSETEEISVSTTPEAKSATSKLDILLPVPFASNVLFVNVAVLEAVIPP